MTPLAIEPVVMKDATDCGVAALAMLLNKPYVQVYQVAQTEAADVRKGLFNTDAIRIAAKLGVTLKAKRNPDDLSEATGLLAVKKLKKRLEHFAVLFQGVLINPADGLIWNVEAYLARGQWKPTWLLEIVE